MAESPIPFRCASDIPSRKNFQVAGWLGSLLIHLALLVLAGCWFLRPARFEVAQGKSTIEVDLFTEAAPVLRPVAKTPKAPGNPVVKSPPAVAAVPIDQPTFIPPQASPPKENPAPVRTSRAQKTGHSSSQRTVAAAKNQTSATPDEIVNQPPVYPEDALQDREQGEVILLVEVTASGTAREVRIAQSSGYFLLDQAALRAVGKWRFHPARAAGVAVSSETRVKVNFKAQE